MRQVIYMFIVACLLLGVYFGAVAMEKSKSQLNSNDVRYTTSDGSTEIIQSQPEELLPTAKLHGDDLQYYFTKQDGHPEQALINLYNTATTTLDVAVYSLTYAPIVGSITKAKHRGVNVRVITDKQQSSGDSQKAAIRILLTTGIPVKVDNHSGLMHLKMSVIDNKIATTGSYNYTMNATENNDEMLVIIYDESFAQRCLNEFNRMWNNDAMYLFITSIP